MSDERKQCAQRYLGLIFDPGIQEQQPGQLLRVGRRVVNRKDAAHAVPKHKKFRLRLRSADGINDGINISKIAPVIGDMPTWPLRAAKAAMVNDPDIELARRQRVAHINEPAAVRTQTMQDEQRCRGARLPAQAKQARLIAHRQPFLGGFHTGRGLKLAPIAFRIGTIRHLHEQTLPDGILFSSPVSRPAIVARPRQNNNAGYSCFAVHYGGNRSISYEATALTVMRANPLVYYR